MLINTIANTNIPQRSKLFQYMKGVIYVGKQGWSQIEGKMVHYTQINEYDLLY